jgi:hypothetical protein
MVATVSYNLHDLGTHAFQKARRRGRLNRCWTALSGHSRRLLTLADRTAAPAGGHFAGVQTVPVRQIRGTEGRACDFDCDFNPLNDHGKGRWLSVFSAWTRGADLPPVDLVRVGESYFVRDGHHRVSVARVMGQQEIEARVMAWL